MAQSILMPALTPTMEAGTLARWCVAAGESVVKGQIIAEIETDKSILELEAFGDGVMGELLVAEGTEGVPVDSVLAMLLDPGEEHAAVTPDNKREAGPVLEEAHAADAAVTVRKEKAGWVRSSPAARRAAREAGIDIASVTGTGPGGRVIVTDVKAAAAQSAEDLESKTPSNEWLPLSTAEKVMAQRMTEAKTTIPHLYCSLNVNVDRLVALRQSLNDAGPETRVSLNDFVLRAVALALKATPRLNVQYENEKRRQFAQVDLSVAVATESGLITPVVRAAEGKSVQQLAQEMKALAQRAHERRLRPEEYGGGTFTVSNVGALGLEQSWPIINPPQAGILGVGRAVKQPAVVDGQIAVATVMALTLSADHRLIDGVIAGQFLCAVRDYLEKPAKLLS